MKYYNKALIESARKQWDKALSDINNVLQINPDNLYAWFNRGVINMKTKNYSGAEKDFTKTITLYPDFAGGYINRAFAREHLGKIQAAHNDRLKAQNIIAFANKGKSNVEILYKRYTDSIYFSKIIRFEADFVNGEIKKGKIQFNRINILPKPDFQVVLFDDGKKSSQNNNCNIYFDKLIVRFNADNEVGLKLAFSTGHNKNSDALIKETELKANDILKSGDTAGYYFVKGIIMYMQQNYSEAIKCYDSTLLHNKSFVYALLNRGATQFEYDNYLWTERQYTSSIGISKTGFSPTEKTPLPTHKKALIDYNTLTTYYPTLAFVYYNRANLKTNLRKFQRAIDDYSQAIKLNPQLAEAYFNRALVLLYLKENELACKDLSKAGELGLKESYNIIKRYCRK